MGNWAAENRAISPVLWSTCIDQALIRDTGIDWCSQTNCEEEDSAMMFFAVFPSEISNSRWINNFRKKSWGRNRLLIPEDFFKFQRFFFCSASTETQGLPKISVGKKDLKSLFRNNSEPEGKAGCMGIGRCLLLWVTTQALEFDLIVLSSWGGARKQAIPYSTVSVSWPLLRKPFLMRVSSASIHSHKVFWWADILQCRGSTGRVPTSPK